MESFALNSGTLNGTFGVPTVAASANVTVSGSFTAAARNISAMLATGASQGSVVAIATLIATAKADAVAGVTLTLWPTHQQSALAEIAGAAEASFFVLRTVAASASPLGTATILAFPEGKLAHASVDAAASLSAIATKTQRPAAAGSCLANVEASGNVIRLVVATLTAGATLRVEAQRNKGVDAFADLSVSAEVVTPNAGIVRRMAAAMLDVKAEVAFAGYRIQGASALFKAEASGAFADPVNIKPVTAALGGGADFVASGTRNVSPVVSLACGSELGVRALQRHQARASVASSGDVYCLPTRRAFGAANIAGNAATQAAGLIMRQGDAMFRGGADVIPVALLNAASTGELLVGTSAVEARGTVYRMPQASCEVGASIDADGTQWLVARLSGAATSVVVANGTRTAYTGCAIGAGSAVDATAYLTCPAGSLIKASAEVSPDATSYSVLRFADCAAVAVATMTATASVEQFGQAHMSGEFVVTAVAFTNVAALDPPERTMSRMFVDRLMSRPFTDREMRRAA